MKTPHEKRTLCNHLYFLLKINNATGVIKKDVPNIEEILNNENSKYWHDPYYFLDIGMTADVVSLVMKEIRRDIRCGHFKPEDIKSFSDLHDYVDANCYLSQCGSYEFPTEKSYLELINNIQDQVDNIIRLGLIAECSLCQYVDELKLAGYYKCKKTLTEITLGAGIDCNLFELKHCYQPTAHYNAIKETKHTYSEWEDAVTTNLEKMFTISRSDAQGIVESKDFKMKQAWARGLKATSTAAFIR